MNRCCLGLRWSTFITLALSVGVSCIAAAAQESACLTDVPTLVTLPDYGLVRQLGPDQFLAHDKHGSVRIEAVETRRGPLRVLFVVETGKTVSEAARRVQTEVISEMLSSGKPEDSFALLTAHGPRTEVHFGANKEDLAAVVREIAKGISGKNQTGGVLDAIQEATEWFQPRREGDAILALTTGIESNSNTSYGRVRDSLLKAHVRLFGFQLGPIIGGYYRMGPIANAGGQPVFTVSFDRNEDNLFSLTRETGGFSAWENTAGDSMKEYRLTDERLQAVRQMGLQVRKAVTEYYSVRLTHPADGFVLELATSVRKDLPQAQIDYPMRFQECTVPPPHPQ